MTGAPPSTRLVGVDIARCLALLGMMATHILPGVQDGEVTTIQQLAGGRASALFAVLAGLSLVLVAGTREPLTGRRWLGMQAGTFVRAVLIAAVGLWLGSLETNIAVILVYYAALFVVGAPFLALPTAWLAVAAAVSTVAGPALSFALRRDLPPPSYDVPAPESLSEPAALLRELVLTGYYPVATWLPYLLVGLLIGRLDLRSVRVAVRLALAGLVGVAVAVVVSDTYLARPGVRRALADSYTVPGWQGDLDTSLAHGLYGVVPTETWSWLMVRAPHSGAWFDLVMTLGSACLVIGLSLLVGRLAPRVLGVVFGAGAMTLTLYTLHVALRQEGWWDGTQVSDYLGQVVLVLLVGAGVRLAGRRGPLEFLVGKAASLTRTAVGGGGQPR